MGIFAIEVIETFQNEINGSKLTDSYSTDERVAAAKTVMVLPNKMVQLRIMVLFSMIFLYFEIYRKTSK
jgi:hypothetical protein